MGCTCTVRACGPDAAALPEIVGAALDEVDRVDRLMSHYRPDSPLSRLNREAASGPVAVEPELLAFLDVCLRWSRESDGAFDVTVGPLMKAWGFFRDEGRVPGKEELAAVLQVVGYRHVALDRAAGTVRFDRPGVELDLGGIGKGYAVDRVVDLLRRRGIASALVNLGGSSVYGLGAPPGREAWEIGIQDPTHPAKTALTVTLRDRALSVSGGYARFFEKDGVTYAHIMDPRTGKPVQGILSVAVLTEGATDGDALDNVLFVQGLDRARPFLERYRSTGRCSSCRDPAAAGGSSASEVEARAGTSGPAPDGLLERALEQVGDAELERSVAEVGLVESAAGPENAGHVRPLPLRHLAAAAEPLELGQNRVLGRGNGELAPALEVGGPRAVEGPSVERAIPRDEHVHLHHRLEVNHVEGGAPRDGVPDTLRGDVVHPLQAGGEGRRVRGAQLGNHVGIDARARHAVRGAGDRASDVVADAQSAQGLENRRQATRRSGGVTGGARSGTPARPRRAWARSSAPRSGARSPRVKRSARSGPGRRGTGSSRCGSARARAGGAVMGKRHGAARGGRAPFRGRCR